MGACCSAPPITEEQRPQIEAIKVELADKGLPIGDWMAYRCLTEAGYKETLLKQCEQMQNYQPPIGHMRTREERDYDHAVRMNATAIRLNDFTGGLVTAPLETVNRPGFHGHGGQVTPLPDGTHVTGLGHGYTQKTTTNASGWTTKMTVGW